MTKTTPSKPSPLTLFAAQGCGSAAIEVLLELADVPFERVDAPPWETSLAATERLRAHNPLGQVPTLVLGDGTVVTESAAIVLWLAGQHPALAPSAPSARAAFHRWVVFLAANVYAALGVGDHPELWLAAGDDEARTQLKAGADARVKACWQVLERGVAAAPGPFLLGETLGALDVYAAMIARWRPGRAWLEASCPCVAQATARAAANPVVARVGARHFD
jgi:GST-like protein